MEKIKHEVGKTYIIDKDFANSGPVILVEIYGKNFCRVRDEENGGEWDTMLYRLSEVQEQGSNLASNE